LQRVVPVSVWLLFDHPAPLFKWFGLLEPFSTSIESLDICQSSNDLYSPESLPPVLLSGIKYLRFSIFEDPLIPAMFSIMDMIQKREQDKLELELHLTAAQMREVLSHSLMSSVTCLEASGTL
jgi:hypothetical protein